MAIQDKPRKTSWSTLPRAAAGTGSAIGPQTHCLGMRGDGHLCLNLAGWKFFLLNRNPSCPPWIPKCSSSSHLSQCCCIGISVTAVLYYDTVMNIRRKHRRTLAAIFRRPTQSGIRWDDALALLKACGADMEERAGSRTAVALNNVVLVLHRAHPGNEINKGAVRSLRKFLQRAGIPPDQ